jgi:hypothetical protein
MHLWYELLGQATLTMKLLRTSRVNPSVSVATHLYGKFDFNRTPLAPPGTRAVARATCQTEEAPLLGAAQSG